MAINTLNLTITYIVKQWYQESEEDTYGPSMLFSLTTFNTKTITDKNNYRGLTKTQPKMANDTYFYCNCNIAYMGLCRHI